MHRSIYDGPIVSDCHRTDAWIALRRAINPDQSGNGDGEARLLTGLAQDALLHRLPIAYNATGNSVAQTICAIYQQNLAVLLDDDASAHHWRDLRECKKSDKTKGEA